jgi:hypothetical protein
MYERFTDRARKVMALAHQEAQRLGSSSVAPEHVLLGLLKEGSGVAAHVLRALDVSSEAIVRSLEAGATPAPPAPPENQPPPNPPRSWWWLAANALRGSTAAPRLPPSPGSKALIEQALSEACGQCLHARRRLTGKATPTNLRPVDRTPTLHCGFVWSRCRSPKSRAWVLHGQAGLTAAPHRSIAV